MGSPESDPAAYSSEKPQHPVSVGNIAMGMFEVTNDQFCLFLNDGNAQYYDEGTADYPNPIQLAGTYKPATGKAKHPAVYVTWDAAKAFCDWATTKTGWTVRLPYEAEWEFACRAGTTTYFSWGNLVDPTQANYSSTGTRIAGSFPANPWGIYDMSGSAMEWCADWYAVDYYIMSPANNPTGPATGESRVLRGGSWAYSGDFVRSGARFSAMPTNSHKGTGFRCVIKPPN
jgi:formylglycine-generating enzyme required for sulfatase activity